MIHTKWRSAGRAVKLEQGVYSYRYPYSSWLFWPFFPVGWYGGMRPSLERSLARPAASERGAPTLPCRLVLKERSQWAKFSTSAKKSSKRREGTRKGWARFIKVLGVVEASLLTWLGRVCSWFRSRDYQSRSRKDCGTGKASRANPKALYTSATCKYWVFLEERWLIQLSSNLL